MKNQVEIHWAKKKSFDNKIVKNNYDVFNVSKILGRKGFKGEYKNGCKNICEG